ncbi:hypothetical protein VP01_1191g6 [Puccinia sorghi]|uniref:Uncharacterized protein n=1 Tax=Puccinia sorghi TaxID=27349 RepID=A0A0L6VQV7_9BASI|nr:hypothetical protein VP01_1191g6 [Puccinia sorghi]
MRLHLYRPYATVRWVDVCLCTHYNMLAWLGDQWMEVSSEGNQSVSPSTPATPSLLFLSAEAFRQQLTQDCVEFNCSKGVLPPS